MHLGDAMKVFALLLLAASIWYIPWRVNRLFGRKGRLWPWRLLGAALMFGYLFAMSRLMFASGSRAFSVVYITWAMVFVLEIYFFVYLLLAHLLSRPLGLKRFRPGSVIAAGLALSMALVVLQLGRTQQFAVTDHVVKVPGLKAPVTILHIVDMHLGAFRGETYLKRVLAQIHARKPDIVIYNGDMVNSDLALSEELFGLFREVEAEQYFTTGNYEYLIDTNRFTDLLEFAGIAYLRSRMVETHGLQLVGLDYMNGGDTNFYGLEADMITELTIADVLPTIPRDREIPTLVVHHAPVGLRHVSMGAADVMLTGTTHSGQKSPLISMFRMTWPEMRGRFDVSDTVVLAAQGGGNYGSWFRVAVSYEYHFITLVPG